MKWLLLLIVSLGSFWSELPSLSLDFPPPALGLAERGQTLSEPQVRQLARSLTVKVLSGTVWGSGVPIERQSNTYTILTNRHVLGYQSSQGWQIQTPDGKIHRGRLVTKGRQGDGDIAFLTFSSSRVYPIAPIETARILTVGEEVFASGFPLDLERAQARGFTFTVGRVALITDRSFGGGYQIGYTNPVLNGMSGGPLLDRQGKLVGINGIHAYPLWGSSYVFDDGTETSPALWERMSQLSWAIPARAFSFWVSRTSPPPQISPRGESFPTSPDRPPPEKPDLW